MAPPQREREREEGEQGAILTLNGGVEEENEEMKSASIICIQVLSAWEEGVFGPDKERASQTALEVEGELVQGVCVCV